MDSGNESGGGKVLEIKDPSEPKSRRGSPRTRGRGRMAQDGGGGGSSDDGVPGAGQDNAGGGDEAIEQEPAMPKVEEVKE